MREFVTSVRAAEVEGTEDEGVTEIPITEMEPDPDNPGEMRVARKVILRAHKPESGQLGYLLATTSGKFATEQEQVAGLLNFFVEVLEDEDKAYIGNRLLDRRDPFGLEEVNDIMEELIEEWGGHPTKQPSDFASSRKSGGRKSTARTPALTS